MAKTIVSVTHGTSEPNGRKDNPEATMRITGVVRFSDNTYEDRVGFAPLQDYRNADKAARWALIDTALREGSAGG